MSKTHQEAIGSIIERVVAREALELVHWEMLGSPGNYVLRVYIDKPGGVTLKDCEMVSKQVGLLLDVEDPIQSRYTLEVSSPGIERGLYKQADYQRFQGSRVKVRLAEPINGQRNFHGKLEGIADDKVKLDADQLGPMEIPYDSIVKANIEFEF